MNVILQFHLTTLSVNDDDPVSLTYIMSRIGPLGAASLVVWLGG
jgi:hypothetical protein